MTSLSVYRPGRPRVWISFTACDYVRSEDLHMIADTDWMHWPTPSLLLKSIPSQKLFQNLPYFLGGVLKHLCLSYNYSRSVLCFLESHINSELHHVNISPTNQLPLHVNIMWFILRPITPLHVYIMWSFFDQSHIFMSTSCDYLFQFHQSHLHVYIMWLSLRPISISTNPS